MPNLTNTELDDFIHDDEAQFISYSNTKKRERSQIPFKSITDFKLFNRLIIQTNNKK